MASLKDELNYIIQLMSFDETDFRVLLDYSTLPSSERNVNEFIKQRTKNFRENDIIRPLKRVVDMLNKKDRRRMSSIEKKSAKFRESLKAKRDAANSKAPGFAPAYGGVTARAYT